MYFSLCFITTVLREKLLHLKLIQLVVNIVRQFSHRLPHCESSPAINNPSDVRYYVAQLSLAVWKIFLCLSLLSVGALGGSLYPRLAKTSVC